MTDRMTDERLAEIERCYKFTPRAQKHLLLYRHLGELIQGLKVACAEVIGRDEMLELHSDEVTKGSERIRELEAAINDLAERWVGYADQLEDEDEENHFVARAYRACAEELQEALADD